MISYERNQRMKFEEKTEASSFLLAENNFGVKTGVESVRNSGLRA
jgi:hypothetical protein